MLPSDSHKSSMVLKRAVGKDKAKTFWSFLQVCCSQE